MGRFFLVHDVALLLGESFVLDHRLLQDASKPHTLFDVSLDFILGLLVLADLHVLLQLLNEPLLLLHLQLHRPILLLQLLHQKRLNVIRLLRHRSPTSSLEVGGLLLQLPCQVFNLLLLLAQIDMHLLGAGAKSRVFILGDVERNLQISVHIFQFFTLLLLENRSLIRLAKAEVGAGVRVVASLVLSTLHGLISVLLLNTACAVLVMALGVLNRLDVAPGAEEDVAGAIVVDDLLDHLAAVSTLRGVSRLGRD